MTAACHDIIQKTLCSWWMCRPNAQSRVPVCSAASGEASFRAGGTFSSINLLGHQTPISRGHSGPLTHRGQSIPGLKPLTWTCALSLHPWPLLPTARLHEPPAPELPPPLQSRWKPWCSYKKVGETWKKRSLYHRRGWEETPRGNQLLKRAGLAYHLGPCTQVSPQTLPKLFLFHVVS